MGVYFPNMKKPPTCSECPVKLDCGLYFDIPDGGIDSNCPVIYVNSPHGKLGDLDKLIANFRESAEECKRLVDAVESDPLTEVNNKAIYPAIIEAILRIKAAPTIVPAEGGTDND